MQTILATDIKEKAAQLGYSGCGIIPAAVFEEYSRALDKRIQDFPESKEFYDSQRTRSTPPDGAKSIIVCVRGYNHYKIPASLQKHIGKYYLFHGLIPYSAAHRAKEEFDAFLQVSRMRIIKSHPPPMRLAAVKAGLGRFGRNNFFYTAAHGSHVHIEAWYVDTELEYDKPADSPLMAECHENCRKCVRACPTNALSDEFCMDRVKCVTSLMYAKEPLSDEQNSQMGQWIYGCDACQDICPMNNGKLTGREDFPLLSQHEEYLQPEKLQNMDDDTYANVIFPRFWFAGKDGKEIWQRNAARAIKNGGSHEK